MATFKVDMASFQKTGAALRRMRGLPGKSHAMKAAMQILFDEAQANLSLADHSLKDLARDDHPYARRHGKITIHGGDPKLVHTQSGAMLNALKLRESGKDGSAYVIIDRRIAPHAAYVIQGTSKMLSRSTLWWTGADQAVQRRMVKAAQKVLAVDMLKAAK